jgi:hypothetical protein
MPKDIARQSGKFNDAMLKISAMLYGGLNSSHI